MKPKKVFTAIAVCSVGFYFGVDSAFAVSYTWNSDNSGDWYDSSKWSPNGVPGGYENSATIERDPVANVTVSLIHSSGLNALNIGPGNGLLINGGGMGFGKVTETMHPRLFNNGSIVVSNWGVLRPGGTLTPPEGFELTIMGSGTITLLSGGSISPVNYGQVIIDIDPTFYTYNTIQGGSQTSYPGVKGWDAGIPLINRGEINATSGYLKAADVRNESISCGGVLRGGILGAHNSGTLVLSNTIVGGIIKPRDGTVQLNGAQMKNLTIGAGEVEVIAISQLQESIKLLSGAHIRCMNGKRLDLRNTVITNNGTIRVEPGGCLINFESQAVFNGRGKILLVSSNSYLDTDGASAARSIINNHEHTIEGRGEITAWINNYGTILANNRTLTMLGALFGSGIVRIEGQDAANLAILDYRATSAMITGSLYINEFGRLNLVNNNHLNIFQDFSFALTDETLWTLAGKTLNMKGTDRWQALEVGGQDLGPLPNGFSNNFNLGTLHIYPEARVYLVDDIDNGNRSSPEALYVNNLILDEGAVLNLNGMKLYTNIIGFPEPVMIDQYNYPDFQPFFNGLLTFFPQPQPDANQDFQVNILDLGLVSEHWLEADCAAPLWCQRADVDKSGDVGLSDVLVIAEAWLQ